MGGIVIRGPSIGGAGGGGGFEGAWAAGTYSAGSIVSRGGFLWAANADTSQDPCVVDGDIGDSADWQLNIGAAGGGQGQTVGSGVLLVNNVNATNANAISKTVRSGFLGQRLITEVSLGGNAQADGFYWGISDGSFSATYAIGTLHNQAGFYGVFFDAWNQQIKWYTNGVVHASVAAYARTLLCRMGNNHDRWFLDYVDAGATMTATLRRASYSDSSGNERMSHGATEINVVAQWTGIAKPAYTDFRQVCGAFCGGFNMRVHVRTGGMMIMPITSDWTMLGALPRFNS